jgi:hypothetical protein
MGKEPEGLRIATKELKIFVVRPEYEPQNKFPRNFIA